MRVSCLGVHHDVNVLGWAARVRNIVRQSSRFFANTSVNHLKTAVVDIVLG